MASGPGEAAGTRPWRRACSREQVLVDGAGFLQGLHGPIQIDGIPKRYGGDDQVQPARPVALISERPIADLAEAVQEHGARKGVLGLAFVEPGGSTPPQFRVPQPLEREQGPLDASELPQSKRKAVLARIGPAAIGRTSLGLLRKSGPILLHNPAHDFRIRASGTCR